MMKNRSRENTRLSLAEERRYMARALELAEQGRGITPPNPLVGAVLVKNGKIVGEGYHRRAGGRHAEIVALSNAGSSARNAVLYVILEPCSHQGRTGPCVVEIIRAGVKSVRYAIKDPNPQVNGKGAKLLRRAGIKVSAGPLAEKARRVNEIYLNRFTGSRPFVILKSAQSLDGRIACATGHSQWISGEESRKFAHRLRAEVDAVVVGAGTVSADNPRLTVRLAKGANPFRITLSTSGSVNPKLRIFTENKDHRTILATAAQSIPKSLQTGSGLIQWSIKKIDGRLSLKDFLSKAWDFGINSILVEGGSQLATSFLKAGLVDKHIVSLAPKTLGEGINAIGDLGLRRVDQAITYENSRFELLGADMVFSGYPHNRVA